MSVKATSFVRRLRGLDATEKAVAFVYADHANHETGNTYPSMDTVAEESGLADRSTASKATGRLAEFKILVTDKPSKGGKPTVWQFNYSLHGCPSTITIAPLNRVPKPRSTVAKSHSPKEPNCDPEKPNCDPKQPNCDPKQPNCDPKQPNCDPESHKGVEPKSKGTTKAGEEAEESLRSRVAASATRIIQAFEMLHVYGGEIYGSPAFQLEWLAAVEDSRFHGGDVLAAFEDKQWEHFKARLPLAIERCIQSCNRKAIKPPGAFYEDAKHARHHSGRFNARGR